MAPEWLWPAGLTLLLLIGAISDVRERRLANWLSLVLLAFGLAHGFSLGGIEALGWHGAHAVIALLVGMAIFAIGVIGGGDAKFYAGMAAYFPLSLGLDLLFWVAISGGLLVIGWMILRRAIRSAKAQPDGLHAKFPYGVAIATGALIVAWQGVLGA